MVLFVLVSASLTPACRPQLPVKRVPPAVQAHTAETEKRMNTYFEAQVTPKLKQCWRVQGEGRIAMKLTYTDAAGGWSWESASVSTSTLAKDQDAIALQCVQDAVKGTSFPRLKGDGDAKQFVVNWSFPVTLPANAPTALARDNGGGTGEPDKCWECGFEKEEPACLENPAGWQGCVELDLGGCRCLGGACTSGGYLGGNGKPLFMY
jgi:hypothetical protein